MVQGFGSLGRQVSRLRVLRLRSFRVELEGLKTCIPDVKNPCVSCLWFRLFPPTLKLWFHKLFSAVSKT